MGGVISDENLAQLKAMMCEVLEEYGLTKVAVLKNAATAARMRRYRDNKRNANVTHGVTDSPTKRNAKRNRSVTVENEMQAKQLLTFLNEKAGKAYRPMGPNIEVIAARLEEGYTAADMRKVIVRKCDQWKGDENMEMYLRPATLFGKTKMAQYTGELVVPT